MEIDIAPQFGAELKVRKTASVFRASTDTVESPGWIQARQRLGTTPYYFFPVENTARLRYTSIYPGTCSKSLMGPCVGVQRHCVA